MCGIAGIIGENAPAVREALGLMSAAIIHRGPDDSGASILPFGERVLGLGFRRLSILDLSQAGHQPMIHPRTGDQIIFNGEIYNFSDLRGELFNVGETFRGHSDTEVLLYGLSRWGPEFIKRLRGMFAFAFYNARESSLLLARDSIGIKPLYVSSAGGRLLFASEVRAILASGLVDRRIDRQGMAGLLAYGAVQAPSTIFHEIRCFPPGTYEIYTAQAGPSAVRRTTYWSIPEVVNGMDEQAAVSRIGRTLEDSVRDHLVADVPVGVFLSSGLDSTVVAGLAARHHPRLRSFTVGFADQPDMSEQGLALQTAKEFGLNHTNITINNSDAEAAAVEWMSSLDQPSMDGLNVYVISKAVRAEGITVALSGQGGDELFGGYPSFRDVPRVRSLLRKLAWLPAGARVALCDLAALSQSQAVRDKLSDMARTDASIRELYFQRRRAMSDGQLASLGLRAAELGLTESFQLPDMIEQLHLNSRDPIAAISNLESIFYQGNMLLRDGDSNGMAHSLEIRVPILDQRMLDLVLAMPGDLRLPPGKGSKHLMRMAFAPLLRPSLLAQKKMGFTLPIRRWMLGPMREMCDQAIACLKAVGLLDAKAVDGIWEAFLKDPESPAWSRAFTLCVLGCYVQRMKVSE